MITTLTRTEAAYTHYTPSVIPTETEIQLRRIESIDDNYRFHIRNFVAWMRSGTREINFESIRDYFAELNRGDYSAGTVRVKRQAVLKRIRLLFKDRPIEERVKLEEALKDLGTGDTRAPKVNSSAIGTDKIISALEYERLLYGARLPSRISIRPRRSARNSARSRPNTRRNANSAHRSSS